jgi:hypothetical protein
MQHAGMVHALVEIHRLLKPDGVLIDIHPAQSETLFEIHQKGIMICSLPMTGQTFQDVRQAEKALKHVVQEGLFTLEREIDFIYRTFSDSIVELHEYITREGAYEESPSNEMLALEKGELAKQLNRSLKGSGTGAQVVRVNPARLSRLKPLPGIYS